MVSTPTASRRTSTTACSRSGSRSPRRRSRARSRSRSAAPTRPSRPPSSPRPPRPASPRRPPNSLPSHWVSIRSARGVRAGRTGGEPSRVRPDMFTVRTRAPGSRARTGTLHLSHGNVRTPAFVPLATKGAVKTLEPREVAALGYELILGNTFHLLLAPGPELVARFGGLHEFMRGDRPIITDSGGFQVFSMGHGGVADEIKGRGRGGGAGVSGPDGDRDRATTGAILSI